MGWAQLIYGPKWDGPKWAGPNRAVTFGLSKKEVFDFKEVVNIRFAVTYVNVKWDHLSEDLGSKQEDFCEE